MFSLIWAMQHEIKSYLINIKLISSTSLQGHGGRFTGADLLDSFWGHRGRSAGVAVGLLESYFSVVSFDDSQHYLAHRWFPYPPGFQIHFSPENFA